MFIQFHKDGTLPVDDHTIFVFGSNLKGVHGAGAALVAHQAYGYPLGIPEGLQGRSYAIPTKDARLQPLPLAVIEQHFVNFIKHMRENPTKYYFMTAIGCGLAGYTAEDIVPMLYRHLTAVDLMRLNLPTPWRKFFA